MLQEYERAQIKNDVLQNWETLLHTMIRVVI